MTIKDGIVRQNIAYPFAKEGDRTIHVSEAEHGGNYTCLGCGKAMIPKRGNVKTHHFAHKTIDECEPDHTLHESAKAHMVKLFQDARRNGKQLDIQHACPCCGVTMHTNMAAGDRIVCEETVIPNTRSDLVVLQASKPHMIIEVVVTHDLEEHARAAYEKSGILTIFIKPSWIASGITCDVDGALNAPHCDLCVARQQHIDDLLKGMSGHDGIPRLIIHDKFGRSLYPKLRSVANQQALLIMMCGFIQQDRLTLFKHETEFWNIYADIDSTKEMPIWVTNADATVYARPKNKRDEKDCIPDCRCCVTSKTRHLLEKHGVHTRKHFYDIGGCWHRKRPNIQQHL